jgi:hypothetical protein
MGTLTMPNLPSSTDVPRIASLLILALSASVLLSAVIVGSLAVLLPWLVQGQKTALALMGFEIVVAVAATLGLQFGRGRFADSPGMALACIGGTILVASALGWQGAGRQLAGVSLMPYLGLRTLAALVILGTGAYCVLQREPRSWKPALLGLALGLPVAMAGGAALHPGVRRSIEALLEGSVGVQALAGLAALIVLGGSLAASVHLVISAFEMASAKDDPGDHGQRAV